MNIWSIRLAFLWDKRVGNEINVVKPRLVKRSKYSLYLSLVCVSSRSIFISPETMIFEFSLVMSCRISVISLRKASMSLFVLRGGLYRLHIVSFVLESG